MLKSTGILNVDSINENVRTSIWTREEVQRQACRERYICIPERQLFIEFEGISLYTALILTLP